MANTLRDLAAQYMAQHPQVNERTPAPSNAYAAYGNPNSTRFGVALSHARRWLDKPNASPAKRGVSAYYGPVVRALDDVNQGFKPSMADAALAAYSAASPATAPLKLVAGKAVGKVLPKAAAAGRLAVERGVRKAKNWVDTRDWRAVGDLFTKELPAGGLGVGLWGTPLGMAENAARPRDDPWGVHQTRRDMKGFDPQDRLDAELDVLGYQPGKGLR